MNLTIFVKTNIVHSVRSLVSPVLGTLPDIVQQIIQLKLTNQVGHQGTLWREFFGHLEQQVNFVLLIYKLMPKACE